MSTITYRDGVMASDSRAYTPDQYPIGHKRKTRRLPDGTLVGVSTRVPGGCEAVIAWYERGADPDESLPFSSFTLMAAKPTGEVYYAKDQTLLSGPLEGEFFAIGSGAEAALGAMHVGADALEAVLIASRIDPWTDGPLHTIQHGIA